MTARNEARSATCKVLRHVLGISRGFGVIGMLIASAGPPAAGGGSGAGSSFLAKVEGHFDEWDQDRDGGLSFAETSRAVPDISVRGEAAAAMAAIHLAQRGERWY